MPFCSECGTATTSKFCPNDGTKIEASASTPTASAPVKSTTTTSTSTTRAGGGLSTNKGDDWLSSGFTKSSHGYTGTERETEDLLREGLLEETNRVFGQLGVTVSAERRAPTGKVTPCGACNKPITGSGVQALGKILHPQCLTCHKCFAVLAGESFVVRGANKDQAWCDDCVAREKTTAAGSAKLPSQAGVAPFRPSNSPASPPSAASSSTSSTTYAGLTPGQRSEFLSRRDEGKTYCGKCGDVMMGDGVTTGSGVAYHEHCFTCQACSKPILPDTPFAERSGKVYHPTCAPGAVGGSTKCTGCGQVLTGKFVRTSDQSPWHRECFVCTTCKKDLSAGYAMRSDKPYCSSCASAATPYITKTIGATSNKDMGGIRYNQVTREVTRVPPSSVAPTAGANFKSTISSPSSSASPASGGGSKFCTNCATPLNGSRFCSSCGQKV